MSATFEKTPHPRRNYAAEIDFSMFLIECQYRMRQVPRAEQHQLARENSRAPGAHKRQRPTDILGLRHSVFTDCLFLYTFPSTFSPRK